MKIGVKAKLCHGVIMEFMRDAGITQKKLAEMAGMCQSHLSALMTLGAKMTEFSARKLAKIIGCSIKDLMEVQLPDGIDREIETVFEADRAALEHYASRTRARMLSYTGSCDDVEIEESASHMRQVLENALSTLTKTERYILEGKLGLSGREKTTYEATSKVLNKTRGRIHQLGGRAQRKVLDYLIRSGEAALVGPFIDICNEANNTSPPHDEINRKESIKEAEEVSDRQQRTRLGCQSVQGGGTQIEKRTEKS